MDLYATSNIELMLINQGADDVLDEVRQSNLRVNAGQNSHVFGVITGDCPIAPAAATASELGVPLLHHLSCEQETEWFGQFPSIELKGPKIVQKCSLDLLSAWLSRSRRYVRSSCFLCFTHFKLEA